MLSASSKTVDTNTKDICEWRTKVWTFEMILFRKSHACITPDTDYCPFLKLATDTESVKRGYIAPYCSMRLHRSNVALSKKAPMRLADKAY